MTRWQGREPSWYIDRLIVLAIVIAAILLLMTNPKVVDDLINGRI